MNKLKMKVIIVFLMCMVCIVSGCGICKNNIVKEINTYDNNYRIVAFIREAGSTTTFSPQVSLIKIGENLNDSDIGNIFRGNKSKYIDIEWKNKNTLIIKYECSDQDILEKCTHIKDINIEYLKIEQ
ncbi:DUF5412 domain-containing protein [Clostridium botulinum C]|uniref:Lipoprotein n=2 Tax=Clostridium botulinum TaxID=1491 RepID=A0A9Q4TM94_CLOBO|nr:DUF5412 family protein [Clostridium botulinum]EGO86242.2 hypothetical protein CBCST_23030 [Clostridium botulinum C str. Stockholm]MCD3195719.1 DUF5412 domain-containing protein [Clostridium botulinum C]MCD3201135.1 DUF5412 domain-containing protein [Clostridium botulinum C]MCD3206613.1 DUF5412 domain-containing protein [Clostridium botulinum C]MCD3209388.1 DUF5412 domain-containing protein [Clostridium botulinum C]